MGIQHFSASFAALSSFSAVAAAKRIEVFEIKCDHYLFIQLVAVFLGLALCAVVSSQSYCCTEKASAHLTIFC